MMNQNLLIIGAGIYGLVAKEIAEDMGCFERIAFVDDNTTQAPDGTLTVGTIKDLRWLSSEYSYAVVAIGKPSVREKIMQNIEKESVLRLATLISPKAHVSSSAQMGKGCIIEPMSVVHAGCVLGKGCLICAGAVVNHAGVCEDYVQVDCNATVAGNVVVPCGMKIMSGTVYTNMKTFKESGAGENV